MSNYVTRRINDTARPFAVIEPLGPHGDRIVAGSIKTEAEAQLLAAAPDLLDALKYARRFLNARDHDTALVEAAIQKATQEQE